MNLFSHKLNNQISEEVDSFSQEVSLFAKIADETKEFCSSVCNNLAEVVKKNESHDYMFTYLNSVIHFEASAWDRGFNVSGLECIMMMFDPQIYRNAQKVTQYKEACNNSKYSKYFKEPRTTFCNDHFAYSFPWDILFNPKLHKTFLFKCY